MTALPRLGEDPDAYNTLLHTLHAQLRPRNLMETQYLELFADAAWKMRRFSRLEAQAWEDDALDEDARLTKLERLSRLHNGLRRQLDRAVRMLSREVPGLFERRTREDVLAGLSLTESQCAGNPYRAQDVERAIQASRHWPAPDSTDALDNAAPDLPDPFPSGEPACEGGPRPASAEGGEPQASRVRGMVADQVHKKCRNEPAPSLLPPPELGAGGRSSHPLRNGEVASLRRAGGVPTQAPHYWGGGGLPSSPAGGGSEDSLASPNGLRVQWAYVTPGPAQHAFPRQGRIRAR